MPTSKAAAPRGRKSTPRTAAESGLADTASSAQAVPESRREQAIREAAYARYEARGCVYGHALEDWLEAEAEVERAFAALPSGTEPGQTGH